MQRKIIFKKWEEQTFAGTVGHWEDFYLLVLQSSHRLPITWPTLLMVISGHSSLLGARPSSKFFWVIKGEVKIFNLLVLIASAHNNAHAYVAGLRKAPSEPLEDLAFAFLTRSQVMIIPLAQRPHFENHCWRTVTCKTLLWRFYKILIPMPHLRSTETESLGLVWSKTNKSG